MKNDNTPLKSHTFPNAQLGPGSNINYGATFFDEPYGSLSDLLLFLGVGGRLCSEGICTKALLYALSLPGRLGGEKPGGGGGGAM
jgi:hypothetical protein